MAIDLSAKSILVIDDFPQIIVTVSAMLRDAGCDDIEAAKSGEQALQLIANKRYDLIVCDYHLGDGKDGRQVLEEARHAGILGYSTAFLMVTGENNLPIVMGAIEHRPDDYLVKPFVKEVLLQRIGKLLKRKGELAAIDQAIDEHNLSRAISLADREIKNQPANTYDLLKLKAELSIHMDKPAQAKALYEQILSLRPVLWARLGLAKVNLLMGECEAAREQFQALLDENEYYIEAYDGLAEALECIANNQQAQAVLNQAIALSPTSGRRQLRLANIAEKNADHETLSKALRASVRFSKRSVFKSVEPHLRLARTLAGQGAMIKALRMLTEAREEFQNHQSDTIRLQSLQMQLYQQTSNKEAMENIFRDALARFHNHGSEMSVEALRELAQACFAINRPDEAKEILAQLVKHHHDEPTVLERVQQAFDEAGYSQDGAELIRDGAREIIAINNEGVKLFKAGDSEAAMSHFEDAAQALPRNRTINLNAAKALIFYMRGHGRDDNLIRRTRTYLNRAKPPEGSAQKGYDEAVQMFEAIANPDLN